MMTPAKRSTLQLDLKDLSAKQSTAGVHHLVLASFTTIALIAVYILINTPSASTASLVDTEEGVIQQTARNTTQILLPDAEETEISSLVQTENISLETNIASLAQPETKRVETIIANLVQPETKIRVDNNAGHEQNGMEHDTSTQEYVEQKETISTENTGQFPELSEKTGAESEDTAVAALVEDKRPVSETKAEEETFFSTIINSTSEPISPVETKKPEVVDYLDSLPWITTKVLKGDTLSQIFNRNDIPSRVAYQITYLERAKSLLKIRPGQEINLKKNLKGEFARLQYKLNTFETLTIDSEDGDYVVEMELREPEIRVNNAKANIYHSLLGAATQAGVSLNTMYNFIAMFGWQVDFTMDIRTGDQFSVIYEELYLDEEKVGDGNIIAAELVVSGKKLAAVRHVDEDGFINYYAPDGDGIKGTFLRTPLKFGHVTSNFSNNRLHPVKKVWTAHKGVDYGAPRGTPILATGDGVVGHAGRKGGYGKTVILRHGGKYETLYAHMNGYAKNIRSGARVKQGDVIGYVGRTGLATGSHLHYEFRIHGVHKNPMTVELPKSEPIEDKYKTLFQQSASLWVAELEFLSRIPLAQNNTSQ